MNRSRREAGLSLIEVVAGVVVLGIAIPPLTMIYQNVAAQSVDDTYQQAALAHADALMEEIASRAYEDPDLAAGSFGTEEGSRAAYDDVDDYDGLVNSPPLRLDGTPLADHGGMTRSVLVHNVMEAQLDPTVPNKPDGSTDFKRITVTVAWTGGRGGELTLKTLMASLVPKWGATSILDVAACTASASLATGNRNFLIDLQSIASYDAVLDGFEISCENNPLPDITGIKYDNVWIWRETPSVPVSTQVTFMNEGSTADRTVAAGSNQLFDIKFHSNISSDTYDVTVVLYFVDGTVEFIPFTILPW
jgi:MSHA pilin protein MshD